MVRPFKQVHEQLNILHNRGLKITNYQKSKLYLMTNNYYSIINGYSRYFWETSNKYYPGTTFDDISMLYFLDRELKFIFLTAILQAEKHLKSITAYTLSERYQNYPSDYLSADFYTYNCNDRKQRKDVTFLVGRFQKIISKYSNQRGNNPIKNHQIHHEGIPFWVMVEYLTFGELKLVIKYIPAIQNTIAKRHYTFISEKMSITSYFTGNELLSFIENIFEIRNICAHDSRLLDFKCKNNLVYFPTLHDRYGIRSNSPKSDVYHTFLILQCFLSKTQYAILHNAVLKRFNYLDNYLKKRGYPIHTNIIMDTLGFPENWYKITGKIPQE